MLKKHEEELLTVSPSVNASEAAKQIGSHIAHLIEDGATLQIGLDAMLQATVQALSDRNDLFQVFPTLFVV